MIFSDTVPTIVRLDRGACNPEYMKKTTYPLKSPSNYIRHIHFHYHLKLYRTQNFIGDKTTYCVTVIVWKLDLHLLVQCLTPLKFSVLRRN
jgi:hypothetical protein